MSDTEHLTEEPQAARGAPGSRDTGADRPAGGESGREPGDIGHEETTSVEDDKEKAATAFTEQPLSDPGRAVPPYEGRKESANPEGTTATGDVGGAEVGGATAPTSSGPGSDTGGQVSPSNETPVGATDDTADDAGGASSPTHTAGTERGEDLR